MVGSKSISTLRAQGLVIEGDTIGVKTPVSLSACLII